MNAIEEIEKRQKFIVLLMFTLLFSTAGLADEKNSPKWCDSVTLSGQLIKGKHPKEGTEEFFDIFLLELSKPLTVQKGDDESACFGGDFDAKIDVKEIQIKDDEAKLNTLVDKKITLTGLIEAGGGGYDVRDVIIYTPLRFDQ